MERTGKSKPKALRAFALLSYMLTWVLLGPWLAILFGGLPPLAPGVTRSIYLVNVGLLAILGMVSLGWLATRRRVPSFPE